MLKTLRAKLLRQTQDEKRIDSLDSLWYKLSLLPPVAEVSTSISKPLIALAGEVQKTGEILEDVRNGRAYLIRWLLLQAMQFADMEAGLVSFNLEAKCEEGYKSFAPNLKLAHWAVPVFAESLGRYLLDNGGPNSIQVGLEHPSTGRSFSLTLAWLDGKLPNQRVMELEAEVATLKAQLAEAQSAEVFQEEELYA